MCQQDIVKGMNGGKVIHLWPFLSWIHCLLFSDFALDIGVVEAVMISVDYISQIKITMVFQIGMTHRKLQGRLDNPRVFSLFLLDLSSISGNSCILSLAIPLVVVPDFSRQ